MSGCSAATGNVSPRFGWQTFAVNTLVHTSDNGDSSSSCHIKPLSRSEASCNASTGSSCEMVGSGSWPGAELSSSWLPARRSCNESCGSSGKNAGIGPSNAQYALGARVRGRLCNSCGNLLCAGNLYSPAFWLQGTRNPVAMPITPHPGHPLPTLRMWVQNAVA